MADTHVALAGTDTAACGATHGELVGVQEALRADGRHFTCRECHKVLTGARKHSRP